MFNFYPFILIIYSIFKTSIYRYIKVILYNKLILLQEQWTKIKIGNKIINSRNKNVIITQYQAKILIYRQLIFGNPNYKARSGAEEKIIMSKSTFRSAIAIANTMMGTFLLVAPTNFLNKGIIQNGIGTLIMSIVMGVTATAVGTLVSGKQRQFHKVVKSQLGQRWSQIMAVFGSIIATFIGSTVFLMTSTTIFEIFQQIQFVSSIGPQLFKSCLLVLFIPLCLLSNLTIIVKFEFVSMVLMWIYILTIAFSFIQNVQNIDEQAFKTREISITNIQYWLVIQGFAFIAHPQLDAILKYNKKSVTNTKAVIGGYLISLIMILFCGILGALSIYKKESKSQHNIIQYFKGSWQYYVLAISVTLYLLSIFPIFSVVARLQCYEVLPYSLAQNINKSRRLLKLAFILVFASICELFIWLKIKPAQIMGFIASILCYYTCYLVPLMIKIKLIRKIQVQQTTSSSSLIQSCQYMQTSTKSTDAKLLPPVNKNLRGIYLVLYFFILFLGVLFIVTEIWYLTKQIIS